MQICTDGLVLKVKDIDEADRVVTILTRERGIVTAFANGAKRMKSKLMTSTQMLAYSNFKLYKNRDRYTIDSADAISVFFGIRSDIEKLSLASYISELTGIIAPVEENAEALLRLALNTLDFLEKDKKNILMLKSIYELRAMSSSGFMPNLVGCDECGCYESESMLFLPLSGKIICSECIAKREVDETVIPVGKGVLTAMRHIVFSEFQKLYSFSLSDIGYRQLCYICELYTLAHIGHNIKTLDFLRTLDIGGGY